MIMENLMNEEPQGAFITFSIALRNLLQAYKNEFVKLADFLLSLVGGKGESDE